MPSLRLFFCRMKLSNALSVVVRLAKKKGAGKPDWYVIPVRLLVDLVGDKKITDVTTEDIALWYDYVSTKPHERRPGRLSPWTVDSYGRALRSFFNKMVEMGHIDASPCRYLKLPRLPRKPKKGISPGDVDKMVQYSAANLRDHAIVLVLRDSGCRVGELVSMRTSSTHIREKGGVLHGRSLIMSQKVNEIRYIRFGHEACEAVSRYLLIRHHAAGEELWLSSKTDDHGVPRALTGNGVYLMMKRIAKTAGVKRFNPHAFRHALAKRLKEKGVPDKVIQEILGHKDIITTLNMYIQYDDDEVDDWHSRFTNGKIYHDDISPAAYPED